MGKCVDSRRKLGWSLVVATVLLCSGSVPATLAQFQTGFLNIDCGANSTHVDPLTGYTWVPDTPYVSAGKIQTPVVTDDLQNFTELTGLRYFDDLCSKNCFSLPVKPAETYLLRATFYYGNYDGKNQVPSFQLAIDGTVMDNFTALVNDASFVEYHYVAQGNVTYLCLLRTSPEQTPFISGISLKPASAMTTGFAKQYGDLLKEGRVMKTRTRINYGESVLVRAPDDFYDRFWFPESPTANKYLSPTTTIKEFLSTADEFPQLVKQNNFPPSRVMQTAVTTNGSLASLLLYPGSTSDETNWFVSVYYGEIVKYVGKPTPRNFTIDVIGSYNVVNLDGTYVSGFYFDFWKESYLIGPNSTMTMKPVVGSLLGPILNGMEVASVSEIMATKTKDRDALAIENIKTQFGLTEWTGDPCVPTPHAWIACSTPDLSTPQPQVTTVNLSGYNLKGSIPSAFAKLWALTTLNLDNNNLTGGLPEYFTSLKSLRTLTVQNNNLSGTIPAALLAANSAILFTYKPGNPLLVTPSPPNPSKKSNVGAIVGATIGGIVGVVLFLVVGIFAYRRCSSKQPSLSEDERTSIMKIKTTGGAKAYSRAEVNVATNNLERELGKGGFGPVYYGVLPDGQEVAVKVSDGNSKQGEKEFFNEVDVLSRVHHKNLVALVGYCQGQRPILLYEYMQNGSLFDHLHGTAGKVSSLNWRMRLHIGLNAAQGLEYLHVGCSPSFIHRDIKSSNILLTPKFDAKVADFGLTKLMGETEDTRVMTNVMGTAGYLDPEYYTTQYISTKSDVYSFGIVLLELITGRLPIDQSLTASGKNPHIAHWVRESLQSNDIDSILDPVVKSSNPNMGAVWKVADLAMQSVEPKGFHRPSMSEVVQELQGALVLESESAVGPLEFTSGYSDMSSRPDMGPSSMPAPR